MLSAFVGLKLTPGVTPGQLFGDRAKNCGGSTIGGGAGGIGTVAPPPHLQTRGETVSNAPTISQSYRIE